jgi:beta-galactosidase
VKAIVALLVISATSLAAQRQCLSMDPGWRFTLGDPQGAEAPKFDDREWRKLDLPHDWSIESAPEQSAPAGGRGGFFPTGIGWYRKAFRMPPGSGGKQVRLDFDGVYQNAEVWINGFSMGKRPYGYSSFSYDVTSHLVSGVNVVAVRVDNSHQPNSRWYSGSGIYRHTWMTILAPVHVAHWGVYLTTPVADSTHAAVTVLTSVENSSSSAHQETLR